MDFEGMIINTAGVFLAYAVLFFLLWFMLVPLCVFEKEHDKSITRERQRHSKEHPELYRRRWSKRVIWRLNVGTVVALVVIAQLHDIRSGKLYYESAPVTCLLVCLYLGLSFVTLGILAPFWAHRRVYGEHAIFNARREAERRDAAYRRSQGGDYMGELWHSGIKEFGQYLEAAGLGANIIPH